MCITEKNMEFADYPKHLRDQWTEIQESFHRAVDRRGMRRVDALNDVRDWMVGKLYGLEIRNQRTKEEGDCVILKELWKSDEYERAERCTESLDKASDKIYIQKMKILDLKKQILGLLDDLKEPTPPRPPQSDKSTQTTDVNS